MREAIGRTFSGVILMRPSTLPEVSERSSVVSAWGVGEGVGSEGDGEGVGSEGDGEGEGSEGDGEGEGSGEAEGSEGEAEAEAESEALRSVTSGSVDRGNQRRNQLDELTSGSVDRSPCSSSKEDSKQLNMSTTRPGGTLSCRDGASSSGRPTGRLFSLRRKRASCLGGPAPHLCTRASRVFSSNGLRLSRSSVKNSIFFCEGPELPFSSFFFSPPSLGALAAVIAPATALGGRAEEDPPLGPSFWAVSLAAAAASLEPPPGFSSAAFFERGVAGLPSFPRGVGCVLSFPRGVGGFPVAVALVLA